MCARILIMLLLTHIVWESFHSHLKSEGFYAQNIKQSNNASIIQTVDEYIHYYNNERIQRKLDNMSPIAYRKHVI
ncbi:hypothetical protein BK754_28030 [Bacillus thuringiensis serovar subtoxicus]|uniref:Integrase catalytic domain-containing protein n=1 Tax=Bacillus thuringiensis serovar subtoxicus TaxID=475791 RepID=A0A9X6FFL1_BACTU|nr:hypothetical protein BK754_28030 [Bacillus thuringiensis serovar subtoxicus]